MTFMTRVDGGEGAMVGECSGGGRKRRRCAGAKRADHAYFEIGPGRPAETRVSLTRPIAHQHRSRDAALYTCAARRACPLENRNRGYLLRINATAAPSAHLYLLGGVSVLTI